MTVHRRSPRRLRVGVVLLALAVLSTVQRAPAGAQPTLPCAGDCDEQGSVSVDELVTGVNIALGTFSPDQCPLFDVDGNGRVTVDELVTGVSNALEGCPGGEVSFDKVSVAMLPGGQETVDVTAEDANGHTLNWTAASNAPNVVSAVKNGATIELTGLSLGSAMITVTTQPGPRALRRNLPVRVYDPNVVDDYPVPPALCKD